MTQYTWIQTPRYKKKWYQFMLDIAWPELIVIGIVAVVAIGPKDLPKVMNTMGRYAGKARMMAQDIQRSFEQLNFEAEAAERIKTDKTTAASAAPAPAPAAEHHKHHAPTHAAPSADATTEEPHDHLGST